MSDEFTRLLTRKFENRIDVLIIQSVIAKPYAAAILVESLKYKTIPAHPKNNSILIPPMYSWPRSSVG
jgi:hypothetical protein